MCLKSEFEHFEISPVSAEILGWRNPSKTGLKNQPTPAKKNFVFLKTMPIDECYIKERG